VSLLLKALKQAETAHAAKSAVPASDFELEPDPPPSSASAREWVDTPVTPSGSAPPARRLSMPQLSLVPAVALLAALIAVGYGVYLYFALRPPVTAPLVRVAPPAAPVAAPVDTARALDADADAEAAAPLATPARTSGAPTDSDEADATPQPASMPAARTPRSPGAARPTRRADRPTSPPATDAPMIRASANAATLTQAYNAYQGGRLDDAQRLYRAAAAQQRSIDALQGLAAVAVAQNRNDDAARLYREILERDPTNAAAQAELMDIGGDTDPLAAESRLKALIERDPEPTLYQSLGNLYAAQRRWPQAQAAYFDAVRAAPDNADYAFNLAVSLEHLHQGRAALPYYRKALDLAKSNSGAARFDRALAAARVRQLEAR
jgi:Tfp pilus assembly protein PilF